MPKILFVSNLSNRISTFCLASINAAKTLSYEFYHAANWGDATPETIKKEEEKYGISIFNIPIQRSPFSLKNIKAYKELVRIIRSERIDYIHCNTPVGGILGRLAGKKARVKKVIYQAHGFHFYKGAPLHNWMFYYPIEKWLAHKTDVLITINKEDYELAKKKMRLKKCGSVKYLPGVGIDVEHYKGLGTQRDAIRQRIGLRPNDLGVISMGDLIKRKNHTVSIKAISRIKNESVKLFICGNGKEEKKLSKQIKRLQVENRVVLLGHRDDIEDLLSAMDVFLLSSKQEGLPRSTMEAMAVGLPCVVSKIRGNTDLIEEGAGGVFFYPTDIDGCAKAISLLVDDPVLRSAQARNNLEKIEQYDITVITNKTLEIYRETFN